jgi:transposase
MPPAYVKPYVKRQKNDAADAEAICEAVTRPNLRFVPTKTPEQQSCLTLHRTRHLVNRQQTAVINLIRAHLAEFGIVAPVGRSGVEALLEVVANADDTWLPEIARACVAALGTQLLGLKTQVLAFDRRIMAWHRSNETSKRLVRFPGSVRRWRLLWSQALLIPRRFDRDATSRPGSGWNSSGGKTSLAASANKAIAICAACSRPACSPTR